MVNHSYVSFNFFIAQINKVRKNVISCKQISCNLICIFNQIILDVNFHTCFYHCEPYDTFLHIHLKATCPFKIL